jgi:hypothetical protein
VRYLVLLAESDPDAWERADEAQRSAVFAAHRAFDAAVAARGSVVSGEALAGVDTATTLRAVDGRRTVTDGPFADTVEQIGGFYVIDVPDLDVAIEVCGLLPAGYTIEIRPVVEIDGG